MEVVKGTETRATEVLATRIQVDTAEIRTMVTETQDGIQTRMEVILAVMVGLMVVMTGMEILRTMEDTIRVGIEHMGGHRIQEDMEAAIGDSLKVKPNQKN